MFLGHVRRSLRAVHLCRKGCTRISDTCRGLLNAILDRGQKFGLEKELSCVKMLHLHLLPALAFNLKFLTLSNLFLGLCWRTDFLCVCPGKDITRGNVLSPQAPFIISWHSLCSSGFFPERSGWGGAWPPSSTGRAAPLTLVTPCVQRPGPRVLGASSLAIYSPWPAYLKFLSCPLPLFILFVVGQAPSPTEMMSSRAGSLLCCLMLSAVPRTVPCAAIC